MPRPLPISDRRSSQKIKSKKSLSPANQITRSPDQRITRSAGEIVAFYTTLLARYGPQNWWPGESPFEVIIGAYLTQNTNWSNVEKAIANLRNANTLSIDAMRQISLDELETLVRPSGYFRQKARNLKTFIRFLDEHYSSSLEQMFTEPTHKLRAELLALNGVGPETADSILLYAGSHPVFVVDAYTRRILERHNIIQAKTSYEEIRSLIEQAISAATAESLTVKIQGAEPRHPASRMSSSVRSQLAQHYNEFHALIVRLGNQYCRSKAMCEDCPLQCFLIRLNSK